MLKIPVQTKAGEGGEIVRQTESKAEDGEGEGAHARVTSGSALTWLSASWIREGAWFCQYAQNNVGPKWKQAAFFWKHPISLSSFSNRVIPVGPAIHSPLTLLATGGGHITQAQPIRVPPLPGMGHSLPRQVSMAENSPCIRRTWSGVAGSLFPMHTENPLATEEKDSPV